MWLFVYCWVKDIQNPCDISLADFRLFSSSMCDSHKIIESFTFLAYCIEVPTFSFFGEPKVCILEMVSCNSKTLFLLWRFFPINKFFSLPNTHLHLELTRKFVHNLQIFGSKLLLQYLDISCSNVCLFFLFLKFSPLRRILWAVFNPNCYSFMSARIPKSALVEV